MYDLYERIESLCKREGITISEMCRNLMINRSSLSELKQGRSKSLSADKVAKIAEYFNVSARFLLGLTDDQINYNDEDLIAQIPEAILEHFNGNVEKAYKAWQARITPDSAEDTHGITYTKNNNLNDLKFALFNGSDGITDEMYEEVKRFAELVKLREQQKGKK